MKKKRARTREKFLKVSRCCRAKQWQKNVQKKCAARAKLLFCQLDLLLFFSPFSLPSSVKVMLHETTRNVDF